MLDELRLLRELQVAQGRALAAADLDRLEELDRERMELHAAVGRAAPPPPGSADLAEARALADLITRDQDALVARATSVRDALRERIGGLGVGRAALASYRPQPTGSSLFLDRSR